MFRRPRCRQLPFDRVDVDAVLAGLFDIRSELISIKQLLEDADGPEEEEATDES